MSKEITFQNWKNPYIDRLQDFSRCIVAGESTGISADARDTLLSLIAPFPRTYLEFGSGSGKHLIGLAERDPDAAFVGFELRYKRTVRTAEKAAKKSLNNLFVVRTTAVVAPEIFLVNSIAGIYVNFPDPWDKKKWMKHRLLNPDFLGKLNQLLLPGGFLSYKTDHREYFEATLNLVQTSGFFDTIETSYDLHNSAYAGDNITTEFENLFTSKGLPTYFLKAYNI